MIWLQDKGTCIVHIAQTQREAIIDMRLSRQPLSGRSPRPLPKRPFPGGAVRHTGSLGWLPKKGVRVQRYQHGKRFGMARSTGATDRS
jgi:hypothetical protein